MDSSGDSKVAVFRARQLLKEKRYADALQVCTDELARGTDDLQLRLIAAHSLLAQGRHEGAKKEAQLVVSEAEIRAEKILHSAHARSTKLVDETNELRRQRTRALEEIRGVLNTHSRLLEAHEHEETRDTSKESNEGTVTVLDRVRAPKPPPIRVEQKRKDVTG